MRHGIRPYHLGMRLFALPILCALTACASSATDPRRADSRNPASQSPSASGLAMPMTHRHFLGPYEVVMGTANRRPAKVFLPLQYNTAKSWPLVILLHGFGTGADFEDVYLGLSLRVSGRGFILLTPNGATMPKGVRGNDGRDLGGQDFWNATDACCDFGNAGIDDVGYLISLMDRVKTAYKVDPNRVFLIGHDNGGFMANRLACDVGDRLAAIANWSGGSFKDPQNCRNQTPVRYLHIHSLDDRRVAYGDAPDYAGGRETIEFWLSRNGCSGRPVPGSRRDFVHTVPGADTDVLQYSNCTSGKPVTAWLIQAFDGRGHFAALPLLQPNFSDLILDFLLGPKSREP